MHQSQGLKFSFSFLLATALFLSALYYLRCGYGSAVSDYRIHFAIRGEHVFLGETRPRLPTHSFPTIKHNHQTSLPSSAHSCPNKPFELEDIAAKVSQLEATSGPSRIRIIAPLRNTQGIGTELSVELLRFAHIFGTSNISVAMGIQADGYDSDHLSFQLQEEMANLELAGLLYNVQFVPDLDEWMYVTVFGNAPADFRIAIVVSGFSCAVDLARLVLSALDNDADMTCAMDTRGMAHFGEWNNLPRPPVEVKDIYNTGLWRVRCCQASVMAISSRNFHDSKFWGAISEWKPKHPNEHSFSWFCKYFDTNPEYEGKIMLHTDVVSFGDSENDWSFKLFRPTP